MQAEGITGQQREPLGEMVCSHALVSFDTGSASAGACRAEHHTQLRCLYKLSALWRSPTWPWPLMRPPCVPMPSPGGFWTPSVACWQDSAHWEGTSATSLGEMVGAGLGVLIKGEVLWEP